MNKRAIGIFDSGVGGLTVLSEIKKRLPNENYIYLGDTKNFPYGSKNKEEIIEISIKNTEKLIELGAKIIIIACGTATSQAIEALKEKFDIPVIGIIEPTVKYVKQEKITKIGVIATEGTIRSGAWENSLKKQIDNIEVISEACPMLATIAEEGKATSQEAISAIKQYMKPFKENKVDKIILGCTHYPIFEKLIREELGYQVELINTGDTVSNEVFEYLKENKLLNLNKDNDDIIFLTKPEEKFKIIAKNLLGFDMEIRQTT